METSTIVEKITSTESRRAFPGVIFNILLHGNATDNNIFVAEVEGLSGGEPPRHVHTHEDEVVTIKEGNITYFIGDDIIFAKPGDTVVLPKNIPHHFVITSERMKVILVATSASFGDFFCSISAPYDGKNIPVVQRPSQEKIKEIVALTETFGIYYV